MAKPRPNPDELLQQVQQQEQREHRGKLKIYLGAAPGVGKTYTMLQDAHQKRQEGLDVIVGIVESHGREEITRLLEGLEILPKKQSEYRGKTLYEFDLDGALKRNPGIILIDEMAHTNAPGLRHNKRWQDIEEILSQGIDVYTTLNVQHIESLNDVVTQITHIHIRETVPDSMIETADVLELIDLSPEDLLVRLNEGKVYFPAQAQVAKENYFRKGNLIALRELALRQTAKYAGSQVFTYRQEHGIRYIWPTQEKILCCVGYNPNAAKIIRAARRMADYLQTDLFVVYVDSPKLSRQNRNEAIQHLRFAEQLGAKTRILTGSDIVKTIMEFARTQNITQLVIGKKKHSWIMSLLRPSLANEIIKRSEEIDVHVITEDDITPLPQDIYPKEQKKTLWSIYSFAIMVITAATGVNFLLFPYSSASDLIMIYVLASTIVALRGEKKPAVFASVLSVLAYDFCFVPPFYSFTVANVQYFSTLIVMLIVTQIISYLTVMGRRQTEIAHEAEQYAQTLYMLSHQLARTRGSRALREMGIKNVMLAFDCKAKILLTEDDHTHLSEKERGIAQWVYDLRINAGWGTNTLSFLDVLYIPLIASQGVVGVLRVQPNHTEHYYTPDQMRLLESFANQIALALEVDKLSK